jgi:hypothetical protein
MSSLRFLAAMLAIPVLGAGAAFHPSVRRYGALARAAVALAMGTVALTLTGLVLTLAGVAWSLPALAAPPLVVSLALGALWSRSVPEPRPAFRPSRRAAAAAGAVAGLSLLLLGWTFVMSGATSIDYLLFWGVKAARFAQVRGIDVGLLRSFYFGHAVPDYPPAVPIVQAWGALAAGRMPWRLVPVTSALWLAAALPLVCGLLRRRMTDDGAAAVGAFWTTALAASLAASISGGNAEAPLLFFESIAIAGLLVEDGEGEGRFLPALMLAGAALTKVEGSVAALLIVAGAAARDVVEGRRRVFARSLPLLAPPVLVVGAWFLFQWRMGLQVGYRSHGRLLAVSTEFLATILAWIPRELGAGTYWLSWAIPIAFLVAARPVVSRLFPALFLVGGLFGFLVFDYMHDATDPRERIGWTAPRVSQPALSACILAAGIASLGGARRTHAVRGATAKPPRP